MSDYHPCDLCVCSQVYLSTLTDDTSTAPKHSKLTCVSVNNPEKNSFYDDIGGEPIFEKITSEFYEYVADDEVLAPMYPEEDFGPAKDRLKYFFIQYWGGPTIYSDTRGHPRLRMRHTPYKIGPIARDRWLLHMTTAIRNAELPPLQEATFLDYVERAAHAMINTFEEGH